MGSVPSLLPPHPKAMEPVSSSLEAAEFPKGEAAGRRCCPQCPALPQAPAHLSEVLNCPYEHSNSNSAPLEKHPTHSEDPLQHRILVEPTGRNKPTKQEVERRDPTILTLLICD